MYSFEKLDDGVHVFKGAVNAGIFQSNGKVLLIDCCDLLPDALKEIAGADEVDMILFTQHRRPNVCGVYRWSGTGTRIIVPEKEKHLFEGVEQYWEDPGNRLHLYHHQPSCQILPRSISVSSTVRDGDSFSWEEYGVRVLDTPGATDGSVSYLITKGERSWCFCGDLIFGEDEVDKMDNTDSFDVDSLHVDSFDCGGIDGIAMGDDRISASGKLWDIYSLQKGDGCMDYHGYLGNWKVLCTSLMRILAEKPERLIPSHGGIIINPRKSAESLIRRLSGLYANYASISSMNHYFPGFFDGKTDFRNGKVDFLDRKAAFIDGRTDLSIGMKPAETLDFPDFIRQAGYTSSLILSDDGDGFLVDCGNGLVIDNLRSLQDAGALRSLEDCWVTHYHDDHADALENLVKTFHCNILAIDIMKDVLENPAGYHLPCLSQVSVSVTGLGHGYQWPWKEFVLTALHFPGQTFYHGGLLVEKQGVKVLFGGDSFSPAGIDDYCSGNRNFSEKDRGFRYCINLIRKIRPDYIINQHQDKAFRFSDEELDYMDNVLAEREKMLADLMPWEHPDFGTDEAWVSAYPYWQATRPGSEITVNVRFTNHGEKCVVATAEPVLPDGWKMEGDTGKENITVSPRKAGPSPVLSDHDGSICLKIAIPADAPKMTISIPLRINWDGKDLGQFRHALVQIMGD